MTKILGALFVLIFSVSSYSKLNLNKKVSVSGLSSGAYMAGQVLVSHSNIVNAAAIIAGGPYYCSEGNLNNALYSCMKEYVKGRPPEELARYTQKLAKEKYIDPVANLRSAKVYLVAGKYDETVLPQVTAKNIDYFETLGLTRIAYNGDIPSGHNFPTLNQGVACDRTKSPYIGNCNFDTAGSFLRFFYPNLKSRGKNLKENYYRFLQPRAISMAEEGVAYIPPQCLQGDKCSLHMSFHGCKQSESDVGAEYYVKVGINEWATTNNIVVLYPQTTSMGMKNPNSCWDWWGYSGEDFAVKSGSQMQAVEQIILATQSGRLQFKPLNWSK